MSFIWLSGYASADTTTAAYTAPEIPRDDGMCGASAAVADVVEPNTLRATGCFGVSLDAAAAAVSLSFARRRGYVIRAETMCEVSEAKRPAMEAEKGYLRPIFC